MSDTIDRYVRFWNSEDTQRARNSEAAFTEDAEYVAPIGVYTGRAALGEFARQFAEHQPNMGFTLREEPQTHHDRVRLRWALANSGEEPLATGTDVLVVAESGRVRSVTTFLDSAPEGFDPDAVHE